MKSRGIGTESNSRVSEPTFLLDTNTCIYLLEGKSEAAKARFESCSQGEVVTSAIVFAEVVIGVKPMDSLAEVMQFFAIVPVLAFDREAGTRYAELPFKRQSFDRLIAAHALALDLTLVTANAKDFRDIPALRFEDWTQ